MQCIKLEPKHHSAWNEFCRQNTWFWHTTHWQEYLQNSKFGVDYTDHSFFIENNSKIAAIVPLIQEGEQLISPGFANKKEIQQEVKRIALENGIKRIQVNSDIREYLNVSGYTCILDLDNINPTKGHKSAIKKAEKYLTHSISDTDTTEFRDNYYCIAGKITRPEITFAMLGKWIEQGFGTLIEALFEGQTAGYVYLLHYGDRAYYFMSCVEPEYKDYNVSHYLQSVAFGLLRQKGIKYYETGEQVYNSLHHQPAEKECNISRFKRGFGGEIVVNPASEYFFDMNFMRQVYTERLKNYIQGAIE